MKHQSRLPIIIPMEAASYIPPAALARFLAEYDLSMQTDIRGNAVMVMPPRPRRDR